MPFLRSYKHFVRISVSLNNLLTSCKTWHNHSPRIEQWVTDDWRCSDCFLGEKELIPSKSSIRALLLKVNFCQLWTSQKNDKCVLQMMNSNIYWSGLSINLWIEKSDFLDKCGTKMFFKNPYLWLWSPFSSDFKTLPNIIHDECHGTSELRFRSSYWPEKSIELAISITAIY